MTTRPLETIDDSVAVLDEQTEVSTEADEQLAADLQELSQRVHLIFDGYRGAGATTVTMYTGHHSDLEAHGGAEPLLNHVQQLPEVVRQQEIDALLTKLRQDQRTVEDLSVALEQAEQDLTQRGLEPGMIQNPNTSLAHIANKAA